eukprot:CAMPEP_0119112318 /NCGR_PEP_ID=MMETSP1180-20130426/39740_1 /TAXON_ID=3052 ORGANISM="Chlamydomonas cf sp, Strain CCMP681" /NCGR_SAMPLE_ID=MMETSP1180 /ASSEMBLY_ACC=CAM_ASM_000741 /LENGTH=106 /DNA_ID=CAMNT_0007099765 /DNA_START=39 /DNA_END=356 /DNA_ORIENTATION=-
MTSLQGQMWGSAGSHVQDEALLVMQGIGARNRTSRHNPWQQLMMAAMQAECYSCCITVARSTMQVRVQHAALLECNKPLQRSTLVKVEHTARASSAKLGSVKTVFP